MSDARDRLRAEAREHLAVTIEGLLRQERLSVDELAERSKIDRPVLERILRGEAEASFDSVYRLAGALGVEPGRLFEGIAWVPDGAGGGRFRRDDAQGG
jgi:transcriptional regulator with XRE-family HTH domain